jgi:hypothetical protein
MLSRSQRPRGLKHELSSPDQTLGSWVRIPLKSMDVCVCLFCVCAVVCAGSGLATSLSPVQGVLRLCKWSRNWKAAKAQQRAVEPYIDIRCRTSEGQFTRYVTTKDSQPSDKIFSNVLWRVNLHHMPLTLSGHRKPISEECCVDRRDTCRYLLKYKWLRWSYVCWSKWMFERTVGFLTVRSSSRAV